jgi:hypothetical protein
LEGSFPICCEAAREKAAKAGRVMGEYGRYSPHVSQSSREVLALINIVQG